MIIERRGNTGRVFTAKRTHLCGYFVDWSARDGSAPRFVAYAHTDKPGHPIVCEFSTPEQAADWILETGIAIN